MRLRNKQTGEIAKYGIRVIGSESKIYGSLAELDADWEDYEEPKGIIKVEKSIFPTCMHIEYSTEEEAEKAVEKLKAWKRLKDKGFKFQGIRQDYTRIGNSTPFRDGEKYLHFNMASDEDWIKENWEDLDLLFGGEE